MATMKTIANQAAAAVVANIKKVVVKEDLNMAAQNATQSFASDLGNKVAETVVAAKEKEEKVDMSKMTKQEIRDLLAVQGIEMSDKELKKILKADLIKKLEETIVKIPVVGKKEEAEMKKNEKVEGYKSSKWDKLVNALVEKFVKDSESAYKALFYKKTESKNVSGKYMVIQGRLWGATADVIKKTYGLKECEKSYLEDTFNALCVRGYLTFNKVKGQNGQINTIFSSGKNLDALLDKIEKKQPVKKQGQKASGKVYNAKFIGTMKNSEGKICKVFIEQ